jgi:hypothetical protein
MAAKQCGEDMVQVLGLRHAVPGTTQEPYCTTEILSNAALSACSMMRGLMLA